MKKLFVLMLAVALGVVVGCGNPAPTGGSKSTPKSTGGAPKSTETKKDDTKKEETTKKEEPKPEEKKDK